MTRNPLINALTAVLYIFIIAFVIFYGTKNMSPANSFFAPVAMISLFTLSAAMMGYFFLYQPAQLYFDGKKKIAVNLFIQTLISFGVITALLVSLLFSGILS